MDRGAVRRWSMAAVALLLGAALLWSLWTAESGVAVAAPAVAEDAASARTGSPERAAAGGAPVPASAETHRVEAALAPEVEWARVEGTVTLGDGTPFAEVGVRLTVGGAFDRVTSTDGSGRFAVDVDAAGPAEVELIGAARVKADVVLQRGRTAVVGIWVWGDTVAVWGRIVATATDRLSPRVTVRRREPDRWREVCVVRAGPLDVYRVALAPGEYLLEVRGRSYEQRLRAQGLEWWSLAGASVRAEATVQLAAGSPAVRQDLVLVDTRLEVEVRDRDGRPIEGARACVQWDGEPFELALPTDGDGVAVFDWLAPGRGTCTAEQFGRPGTAPVPVELAAGGTQRVRLTLASPGIADVRLVDERGAVIPWRQSHRAQVTHLATGAVDDGQSLPRGAEVQVRSFHHCGAGPCEFALVDERGSGWVRYGELTAAPVPFTVPQDDSVEVAVRGVRRRARGTFVGGAAPADRVAGIAVRRLGVARTNVLPALDDGADAGRWSGWLEDGDYEVLARVDGEELRHRVTVAGADVAHAFAPR
ncbi:MAG: carboxypeptidase-like regulatory domain-containing protein [Planctomycetota bacterium]